MQLTFCMVILVKYSRFEENLSNFLDYLRDSTEITQFSIKFRFSLAFLPKRGHIYGRCLQTELE